MKLMLYSNIPLDDLEKVAHEYFANIPNKNLEPPIYKDMPFNVDNQ